MADAHRWTTDGFIDEFRKVNEQMEDTSFAFVLGAGASKDSEIPTGGELVEIWLEDLRRRYDGTSASLEAWATADNLGIPSFDYTSRSSFYPQVFERRFGDYLDQGYAALEKAMEEKKPSFGYAILAKILSQTRHRVVVTTNFDNLVSDALFHFTEEVPLVCGHESLAKYIRARMRRPVIAKIHRDLLLSPISDTKGTSKLSTTWGAALKTIFTNFSPIFIGYGGNDGSLMGYLEQKLKPGDIAGRMYWCYLRNATVPERVEALVKKHRGALVPIDGFDLLMFRLAEVFNYPLILGDEITKRAEARAALYRKQVEDLMKKHLTGRVSPSNPTIDAVHALISSPAQENADVWWVPMIEASREPDAQKRRALLQAAAERFPDQPQIVTSLAWHTVAAGDGRQEAAKLVDAALKKYPDDVPLLTARARLYRADRKLKEAERTFNRALTIAPDDLDNQIAYAIFLAEDLGRVEEAESIMRRVIETNPDDGNNMSNYTEILLVADRLADSDAAWQRIEQSDSPETPVAVAFFHRALIAQLRSENDTPFLARLKWLFQAKPPIEWWNFDAVFRFAEQKGLAADTLAFYRAIAAALVDSSKRDALDQLPLWRAIVPIITPSPD